MRTLLTVAVLLVFGFVGCSETKAPPQKTKAKTPGAIESTSIADEIEAAAEEVAAGDAILLDVREQSEWDKRHFSNSILVPKSKLDEDVSILETTEGIDKTKLIYTHCAKGKRAEKVAELLKENGYNVKALKFTYEDLSENGFEDSNEDSD